MILPPNKSIKLVFWIALFESIGFLLSLITKANIHPWYENLNKSILTPPGFVFSIVWPSLYCLLGLIAWMMSSHPQNREKYSKKLRFGFGLQILMNWGWTPLFFQLHWLGVSAIWLLGLTAFSAALMICSLGKQKLLALLLMPYVLWLMFASYLNAVIAFIN